MRIASPCSAATAADDEELAMLLTEIDHVAIAVNDLDAELVQERGLLR